MRNKIIYWIATVWLALGMVSTGVAQLLRLKTGPSGVDSVVAHLGYPDYVLSMLAVLKILGVIVVLAPRVPLLKEWAYAGFVFMMTGAAVSHLAVGDGFGAVFPSLLLLALAGVSWVFRPVGRKVIFVHP